MSKQADELRRQAEEQLAARDSRIETLERADLVSLAHELAVHQMELEIQNEELHHTQLEAQDARDRYLDLYDFAPVAYFTLDEDNRIVEANLTGCRLLKAKRQDLLKTRLTKFLSEEDADTFYLHRKDVLAGGVRQTCELRMVKADGTAFDARLESIKSAGGRLRVAVLDVTERKQTEEALRESEATFRAIGELNPFGVWECDPDGGVVYLSPSWLDMVGMTLEQCRKFGWMERYAPGEGEKMLEAWRQCREAGVRWEYEYHIYDKDRRERWVLSRGFPMRDQSGRIVKWVGLNIDITERKQAESALREWNATLESKVVQRTAQLQHRARQLQKMTLEVSLTEDRERKRMAEILHDDLQQIIAGTNFHLGLLRSRVKSDVFLQALAAQIEGMLKEAIEKSRGLSHELSPAVLYHGDFVETLGWLARQMQAKHGLVVHVRASGPAPLQSEAIRGFLYRAVQELLFNVAKHARVNEARIRLRRRGQCVCLSISDRGRGFDPQELRETAGYGLLSIRERIELLGGRMKIKSAAGKGSTFYIVVPDGETKEVGSEVETRSDGRALDAGRSARENNGRLRVLLADDHRIVREGLRSLLSEDDGIEIVGEAAHGREAVDLALRLEPDVVIMDVSMPLIDGDAATCQIKAQLPRTRVIALSTYNEPEMIQKMYRAGAEGYILKTASSEELLAAIRGSSTCRSSADQ